MKLPKELLQMKKKEKKLQKEKPKRERRGNLHKNDNGSPLTTMSLAINYPEWTTPPLERRTHVKFR